MPISAKEKSEPSSNNVGFYVDDNGRKQDDFIHEEILSAGDHEAALEVSRAVAKRLGLDPNVVKTYRFRAGDWDESLHPRDDRGRFGHGGGGSEGTSGGGKKPAAAPAPKKNPPEIEGLPKNIKIKDFQLSIALERGAYTFKATEQPKRYESDPARYNMTITPTIPKGVKSFVPREYRGNEKVEYYNPKLAQLEKFDPGTPYPYTVAQPNPGLSKTIEPLPDKDIIYRGITYEGYQRILETGKVESRGVMNMQGQEGLTYWSTRVDTAVAYANGFAPWSLKPTFDRPAYVIATRMPKETRHVEGVGAHEVGVARAIDKSEIVGVWRGDVYSYRPGEFDLKATDYSGTEYRTGSGSGNDARVVWSRDNSISETAPLYSGTPESAQGATKQVTLDDFENSDVDIPGSADIEPYLDSWNKTIGMHPRDFKRQFLGGLKGTMEVSFRADGQAEIEGRLQDARGRNVGYYDTEIDTNRGKGELGLLELVKEAQGQGIAKKFMAGNVEYFKAHGITKVGLHANIDVGGHAWARFGFTPSERSWRGMQAWIYDKLNDLSQSGKADDDEIDALRELSESDDPQSLWVIADSEYGKDILLDSDWMGTLDLNDKEMMERFNAYIGRKVTKA